MTSHRITFLQAVILLIGVGVMLMVEPVCRGIVFGRSGLAPGRAGDPSDWSQQAVSSTAAIPIAGEPQ